MGVLPDVPAGIRLRPVVRGLSENSKMRVYRICDGRREGSPYSALPASSPVIARNASSIVRGARRRDELRRRCVGQHLAAMEHDHAVGVRHLVAQMRRPQHGDAALGAHCQQELEQVAAARADRARPSARPSAARAARACSARASSTRRRLPPLSCRGLVVGAVLQPEPRKLLVDACLRAPRAACRAGRRGTSGWRSPSARDRGSAAGTRCRAAPAPAPGRATCRGPSPRCGPKSGTNRPESS